MSTYYLQVINDSPQSGNNYAHYGIDLLFIASFLQMAFGAGNIAPPFIKFIIALAIWGCVIFSFLQIRVTKEWSKLFRYGITYLLSSTLLAFVYSLIWGEVLAGNKFIVLFTHLQCTLNLVGVAFVLLINNYADLCHFLKNTSLYIVFSLLVTIVFYKGHAFGYGLAFPLLYLVVFLPYLSAKNKIFFILGFAGSLLVFFEGARQVALSFVFCVIAFFCPVLFNKKINLAISIFIILFPILCISLYSQIGSMFNILGAYVGSENGMNVDTRTFLYKEFIFDFSNFRNLYEQLFGAGSISYYYSPYFSNIDADGVNGYRLCNEVPLLQYISQCGILYFIILTFLVFYAIVMLHKNGRNRMSVSAMLMIAGYYCSCFASNFTGCNIMHLGFWFLMSLSVNKHFLEADDDLLTAELSK